MKRLLLGCLLAAFVGAPALAAEPPLIDDWRKVGPPDGDDPPHAKGQLSPAAAQRLVAAIDRAWKDGRTLRAREERADTIQSLLLGFRGAPDPAPSRAPGSGAIPKEIAVIGQLPVGRQALLLLEVRVDYFEPAGDYLESTLSVLIDAGGEVTDIAVVADGSGDGCYWTHRSFAVRGAVLDVADEHSEDGELCQGDPDAVACCEAVVGVRFELTPGASGRFVERSRRPSNPAGRYVDPATNEQLLVEVSSDGARVGYRGAGGGSWRPLRISSFDRRRGVLAATFAKSPVVYTLTGAPDGRALVSAGSDGSKPQRFSRAR